MFNRRNAWLAGCVSVLGLAVGSVNGALIDFEEAAFTELEGAIASDFAFSQLGAGATTLTGSWLYNNEGIGAGGGKYVFVDSTDGTFVFNNGPVEVSSIFANNFLGGGSVSGLLNGVQQWTTPSLTSDWVEYTDGAGFLIDTIQLTNTYTAIDQVSAVVPEPASLGLLAVGGLMMLRRRAM